ncbi:ABC transporter substrate-binding protein [Ruminococcaceae bacterium OttesenSCG-928-A16]|nr:ABC transporter substrate-binding protein [Ruminococcaceae bacterium OttesenSCG-928-A16]
MKKVLALCLAVACTALVLAGCNTGGAGSAGQKVKIGVIQFVAHDALDAAYKGFVDGLAEAGYKEGENVSFDFQNAQGEIANCSSIATKLVNDKNDLILAIATPAAQAVAQATGDAKNLPVLVTAVTDPQDAGLVASNEAPGGNVTGTSDLAPVAKQIELLKQLVPEAKTIGFLYSSSEANSVFQIDLARAAAEELGLTTQDFTVSSTNEMQQVVQSMVGKVDAVYAPTDNMIASGMPAVAAIANQNKLPVIVGEVGMVQNGALASYSLDYYELGKITAGQAVKILKGEATPATMPIEYQTEFKLELNEETAQTLGITIPADLQ